MYLLEACEHRGFHLVFVHGCSRITNVLMWSKADVVIATVKHAIKRQKSIVTSYEKVPTLAWLRPDEFQK